MAEQQPAEGGISFFERYLTVWVAACIVAGVMIGQFLPVIPEVLSRFEYASVSIPVAVLIWMMIYPMMLKVDFHAVTQAGRKPKGLVVTLVMNWLIKPFTMYFFAWLFLEVIFAPFIPGELAAEYIAGAVLLGAAPCTAMVFVWSYLTKGDAGYTLIQVSINNLILLVAYAPIVMLLLSVGNISVPIDTVLLSVGLFIVIPLVAGWISRELVIRRKGETWFRERFVAAAGRFPTIGLLITLILLFSFQGETILNNTAHILLIAIPLTIQTGFIFAVAYLWSRAWRIEHCVAAPAGLIGASNFFELAVAVAISVFGLQSGAALATVVGVLVEVPVMLALVKIANRSKGWYEKLSGIPASD
ncbi:MAG: ACR3 family arsenite efflux transporter [Spirochaeta sp.]